MLNIGQFFKKIQNKYSQELIVRSVICAAICKHAKFNPPVESIELTSSIVTIKGLSAMQRSQIFIKKQMILEDIRSQKLTRVVDDIR